MAIAFAAATAAVPALAQESRPLGLRDVMALAARRGPAVRPAQDGVTQAEFRRDIARSRQALQVAPVVSLGHDPLGGSRRELGMAASKRLPTGTDLSTMVRSSRFGDSGAAFAYRELSFGVSQSVLHALGPAGDFDGWSARRHVESAGRALAGARQRAALDAAAAFFAIVREDQLAQAGEIARARAERLTKASAARAKAGLSTQLDVMRAELLFAQAESTAAVQREAAASARDRLNTILGRDPDAPLAVTPDELSAVDAIAGGAVGEIDTQIAHAVATRAEMHDARARVEDATRAAAVARWSLLPDLRISATYTRREVPGLPPSADPFNGWRVGLTTGYAVDRGAARAAAGLAALSTGAAEQDLQDLARTIAAQVRGAHRLLQRAEGTLVIQQRAVEIAERQRRLAELRYERGLADNVDIIDAEASLFAARSGIISAQVDRALARLQLAAATGVLDVEKIR